MGTQNGRFSATKPLKALDQLEAQRLEEQVRLDALKDSAERNKLGQFATPSQLALSLTQYALGFLGNQNVRFLDPAIGTGSFFSALLRSLNFGQVEQANGVEIDPLFASTALRLWSELGLCITQADFTKQSPPSKRFNFIVANPPYVRHHHLPSEEKVRLGSRIADSLGLKVSGLTGLYCYFLLLCHDWMDENGIAVWLIPSEFMDVNYGSVLRLYLSKKVTLLHIHRFCPTDVQFSDALVSSAVVIYRKSSPPKNHSVRFSFGGPIGAPETSALLPIDTLIDSNKWTHFPKTTSENSNNDLNLGDLFTIKRGLATGSNDYFILTEAEVENWCIPRSCVKPILPNPRHLKDSVIQALPNGAPDVLPGLFLLDCHEPEELIKARWPRFYEYIEKGKAAQTDQSYLASRRRPSWYSQEQRPPAPFLCTYMGRARNGKHPFRFIWNRSKATAHNVYLMLYPKPRLFDVLRQHPELEGRIFEALQNITPGQLLSEGRVYGGGLHKVEPKELAQIDARPILDIIKPHTDWVACNIGEQQLLFS